MMGIGGEIINFMLAFGLLMVAFFFGLNFLTKGFIATYLRVKGSQGRKVLVRIHSATEVYHRAGQWTDGFFKYKTKGKEVKSLKIDEPKFREAIFYTMNVPCIEVDEPGNRILLKNLSVAQMAVDAGELETVLIRIKNRPVLPGKKEQIMILLLVMAVLGIGYAIYMLYGMQDVIINIANLAGNVR
jgi:hypothetical protein